MDKHNPCPWRAYNVGEGGVGIRDPGIFRHQAGRQADVCFFIRCSKTCAWRNQRKLPRGGANETEPRRSSGMGVTFQWVKAGIWHSWQLLSV